MHSLKTSAGLAAPAFAAATLLAATTQAGTVANWKEFNSGSTNSGLNTNSPTFGDGSAGNANSSWIAGQFGPNGAPVSVTLAVGETLTISGGMILTGDVSNNASEYRFGAFNDGGQFDLNSASNWTGGWLHQSGTGLFQGRTDGVFISSSGNASNIGASGSPTGSFDSSSTLPYNWSMSITRDTAGTVDIVSSISGGDGSYSLTYTKNDQATSLFTYTAVGVLFGGNSGLDQGQLTNVQYNVVPEPSSLALLSLGGLLIARRRQN